MSLHGNKYQKSELSKVLQLQSGKAEYTCDKWKSITQGTTVKSTRDRALSHQRILLNYSNILE